MSKRLLLSGALLAAACSGGSPAAMTLAELPSPSTDIMLVDIKTLSSDEFEGRMPGSKGEALTVEYLVKQLKDSSLEPGAPNGEWLQKVSLVGLTPQAQGPLVVRKGAAKKTGARKKATARKTATRKAAGRKKTTKKAASRKKTSTRKKK